MRSAAEKGTAGEVDACSGVAFDDGSEEVGAVEKEVGDEVEVLAAEEVVAAVEEVVVGDEVAYLVNAAAETEMVVVVAAAEVVGEEQVVEFVASGLDAGTVEWVAANFEPEVLEGQHFAVIVVACVGEVAAAVHEWFVAGHAEVVAVTVVVEVVAVVVAAAAHEVEDLVGFDAQVEAENDLVGNELKFGYELVDVGAGNVADE